MLLQRGRPESRHNSHYVGRRTDTPVIEASTIRWLGGSSCAGEISWLQCSRAATLADDHGPELAQHHGVGRGLLVGKVMTELRSTVPRGRMATARCGSTEAARGTPTPLGEGRYACMHNDAAEIRLSTASVSLETCAPQSSARNKLSSQPYAMIPTCSKRLRSLCG
jgi:hypothetical protein